MEPVIKKCTKTLLAGHSILMSLSDNRTLELWKGFMPQRKNIMNVVGTSLYSVQVFPAEFDFCNFHPGAIFEKWAAVAVKDIDDLPAGMKPYVSVKAFMRYFNIKVRHRKDPRFSGIFFQNGFPLRATRLTQDHISKYSGKNTGITIRNRKKKYGFLSGKLFLAGQLCLVFLVKRHAFPDYPVSALPVAKLLHDYRLMFQLLIILKEPAEFNKCMWR